MKKVVDTKKKKKRLSSRGGFTLVELLATIAVLSLVITIVIFTATSVINNAREKSYQVTINNIEKEAGTYVMENAASILWKQESGSYEYQCVTVQHLIDKGYFSGDVLDSEIDRNVNVKNSDYIYVERDNNKTINKKILLFGDRLIDYDGLCSGINTSLFINASVSPIGWSREKEITIKYSLFNDVSKYSDYKYHYDFDDIVETNVFNSHTIIKTITVTKNGDLYASINDINGNPKDYKTLQITKIDRVKPVIEDYYNGSSVVRNKVIIPIKLVDNESGIDVTSFTKDDIVVKIGNTIINDVVFTKVDDLNYKLEIKDNTHEGELTILIDENNVLDNVSNGNDSTILKPGVSFTNKYTISYNANGGTGNMIDTVCVYGQNCKVKDNTFVNNGYTFNGWTTKNDGSDDSFGWTSWNGVWKFLDGENGIENGKLVLYARWVDTSAPSIPTIIREDYNTFTYSATDNIGVTGYYVSTSSTKPTTSSSWTTSVSKNISEAKTYYVWARDAVGNISGSSTITAYTVKRSQGTGTTLNTRYDSTSSSNGTSFTSNLVVLHGTNVFASAVASKGYISLSLKKDSTSIDNPSYFVVTSSTTITSSASRALAPTVPTYEAFYKDGSGNYTSGTWANKQVNTTLSTIYSGDLTIYMQYKEDIASSSWNTFTFGEGALSKSGTTYSGTEPWNLRQRNQYYYFRACEVGLDGVAGNSDDLCSEATSTTYNIRYDITAPVLLETSGDISSTSNATPGYYAYFASDNAAYTSGSYASSTVYTKITAYDKESGTISKIQYTSNKDANSEGTDHTTQWKTLNLSISGGIKTNSNGSYYGTEGWTFSAGRNDTFYFRACDSLGNCSAKSSAYNIKYANTATMNVNCSNKTYSGLAQTITSATSGTGFTLSNYSQTNAGTYTVTATLSGGYIWSDNTTDNKTLSCIISKATPTITLSPTSGTVTAGKTVSFVANVKSGGGTVSGSIGAISASTSVATVNSSASISNATISGKSATFTVNGVAKGTSTITVSFTPSDTKNYNNSASVKYTATVNLPSAPSIPTIKTIYGINNSRVFSSHQMSPSSGTYVTSGGDPWLLFNNIDTITGINGAFVQLSEGPEADTGMQIYYATQNEDIGANYITPTFTKNSKYFYTVEIPQGNWKKLRYDFGDGKTSKKFPIIHIGVVATANQWNRDNIILRLSSTGDVAYWQYTYSSSATTTGTNHNSTWVKWSNSNSNNFIPGPFTAERNQYVYIRACNSYDVCSDKSNTYIKIDKTVPTVSYEEISSTQVKLKYSDNYGVIGYYFGTSNPADTDVTYTSVSSTTSGNVTKTVSAGVTYYFAAKDSAGNVSVKTVQTSAKGCYLVDTSSGLNCRKSMSTSASITTAFNAYSYKLFTYAGNANGFDWYYNEDNNCYSAGSYLSYYGTTCPSSSSSGGGSCMCKSQLIGEVYRACDHSDLIANGGCSNFCKNIMSGATSHCTCNSSRC